MSLLDTPAIWSLSPRGGRVCDLPVIPVVTRGAWGADARVLEDVPGPLVWGWTGPSGAGPEAAARYTGRLIADVELRSWHGGEIEAAKFLAARCPAVTSHGFVAPALREVLQEFASRDRVGLPQVYDTDQNLADPAEFLRRCVASYQRAGFRRVTPLLGLSAGAQTLTTWITTSADLGLVPHFYSLERLRGEDRGTRALLCSGSSPASSSSSSPGASPAKSSSSASSSPAKASPAKSSPGSSSSSPASSSLPISALALLLLAGLLGDDAQR